MTDPLSGLGTVIAIGYVILIIIGIAAIAFLVWGVKALVNFITKYWNRSKSGGGQGPY